MPRDAGEIERGVSSLLGPERAEGKVTKVSRTLANGNHPVNRILGAHLCPRKFLNLCPTVDCPALRGFRRVGSTALNLTSRVGVWLRPTPVQNSRATRSCRIR